jgi:hypothetical protein
MFWINNIPLKNLDTFKLNEKLQTILNKITSLSSILIFDIEFQSHFNERYLLEMGGILLIKQDNKWFYYGNFHFNLPPVKTLSNLNVIISDYINVSKKTEKKIINIEKQYLYHRKLEKYKDNLKKFIKYYNSIKNSPIILKKKIIVDLNKNNLNQIIKKIKETSFNLKLKDIGSGNFYKIWNLYLEDKYVKQRTIIPTEKWLKSLYDTLTSSLLMVKGNMDIIAINNLMKQYNLPVLPKTILIYDIAFFNEIFRKLCKNAQLETTYHCIIEKNLLDPELNKDFKQIFKSLVLNDKKLIAHNPLVDSFYTLIVGLTMYNNNKLQNGGGSSGSGSTGDKVEELIDKISKFEIIVTKIIDKFSDKLTDPNFLNTHSEKVKEILKTIKLLSNKSLEEKIKKIEEENKLKDKEFDNIENLAKDLIEEHKKKIEYINLENDKFVDNLYEELNDELNKKCDDKLKIVYKAIDDNKAIYDNNIKYCNDNIIKLKEQIYKK